MEAYWHRYEQLVGGVMLLSASLCAILVASATPAHPIALHRFSACSVHVAGTTGPPDNRTTSGVLPLMLRTKSGIYENVTRSRIDISAWGYCIRDYVQDDELGLVQMPPNCSNTALGSMSFETALDQRGVDTGHVHAVNKTVRLPESFSASVICGFIAAGLSLLALLVSALAVRIRSRGLHSVSLFFVIPCFSFALMQNISWFLSANILHKLENELNNRVSQPSANTFQGSFVQVDTTNASTGLIVYVLVATLLGAMALSYRNFAS
ncbi:hypothetical protein PYCC9005_003319 [Savitreella phatthalungensis]